MKKVIFISLFISAFLSVVGQSIDENTALTVAKNFYQQYNHQKSNALQLYYAKTDNKLQKSGEKTTYYYIFNDGNEGFVVVAGDQRAMPVLGYSTESAFDTTGMPDNIRDWFKGYEEEIAYAIANIAEQPQENADWWQAYINNDIKPTQKATMDVSPLCSTTWDQIAPYNQLCPYDDSSSTRTVVGCVATAMAQIMKFWNFPTNGIGSHSYTHSKYGTLSANFANTTYQWTSMPNKVTTTSTTTAKTAVATLMYHCGVAVNMNYNTAANGGSAASTLLSSTYIQQGYLDAVTALVRFFGYAAQGYYKSSYTDANWIAMLKTELDAGRPVMYAGQGTKGGHAFVCDGYNSNNYFHFNWGWSGKSDGDFLLTALNPGSLGTGGGSGGFNSSQKLVTIYPNLVDLKHYGRMLLAQSDNGRVLNTTQTMTANTKFFLRDTIANYGQGTFKGVLRYDILNADRTIKKGEVGSKGISLSSMRFTVFDIPNNGLSLPDGTYYVQGAYKDSSSSTWYTIPAGNYYNLYAFTIKTVLGVGDKELFKTMVYPNPAQNIVHFQSTEALENAVAEFVDMSGKVVYRTTFSGQETTFDISQLSKGVYILNVKVPNNVLNYKIIKQ